MKKTLITGILALTMLFAASGCGNQTADTTADTQDASSAEKTVISDASYAKLQSAYSELVTLRDTIENAVKEGSVTLTDEESSTLASVGEIITQIGEIKQSDLESDADAKALADSMNTLAQSLGSIVIN